MGLSTKRLTPSGHSSQNSFSRLLNPGWLIQFSGVPAVCEAVRLVTSGCNFQKHLDNGLQIWGLIQTLSGKNVVRPSMASGCHFNVMAKFIANNRTDAWKTDVKLFFMITNSQIVHSRSLPHRINYMWVIDQVWGQDGWILAKFFFCVFMDRDGATKIAPSCPLGKPITAHDSLHHPRARS